MPIQTTNAKPRDKSDGGCLSTLLMALFAVALIYGMAIWELPNIWDGIAFLVGELLIGIAMIWTGAGVSQQNMVSKLNEAAVAELSSQSSPITHVPVPQFRVFLNRSAFIFGGIVLSWGLIWSVTLGSLSVASPYIRDNFDQSDKLVELGSRFIMLPFLIAALLSCLATISIVIEIIDKRIYKNDSILKVIYDSDEVSEIDWRSLFKGLGRIIVGSVGFTLIILVAVALQVGGDSIDVDDLPTWASYICIAGMLLFILGIFWWSIRFLTRSSQAIDAKIEKKVIKEFGVESEEYQDFMIASQRRANSIEGKVSTKGIRLIVAAMVFIGIAQAVIPTLFSIVGLPLEYGQTLLCVVMGLTTIGIFRGLSRIAPNIEVPEEFTKIEEAIEAGDYEAAKIHADALYEKMPPTEGNFAIALAYGAAGDTQKARAFAQEALDELMAQDAEDRNTVLVAQYLWIIAAMLNAEGRYDEAIKTAETALKYNPEEVPAHTNLAEALLYLNESTEKALYHLEKAFESNQKKPPAEQLPMLTARMLNAWGLTQSDDYEAADLLMEEVYGLMEDANEPTKGEIYYLAGQIFVARRKFSVAQDFFKKAIATDPGGINEQLAQKALDRLNSEVP